MIPPFQADGLLPPGDYEVSFEELRKSLLIEGPASKSVQGTWDQAWRGLLVDNLEVLVRQLWTIGIREIYADGSFAEDKDHPNDIDGYFVCGLKELASGELVQRLNLLDPYKIWTWDPQSRNLIVDTRKDSSPCGIGIGWRCIRMCLDLDSRVA